MLNSVIAGVEYIEKRVFISKSCYEITRNGPAFLYWL